MFDYSFHDYFLLSTVHFCFSVCPIDGSLKELSIGAGGKKNRQKERRLMKGFNIAPQPGSSSTLLEPVAELIASWKEVQREVSHHEIFGSTRSEIFGLGTMSKKSLHHSNACRQSRGPRSSSKKKRWDTLIEAAKAHKVSKKFISKILEIDRFN